MPTIIDSLLVTLGLDKSNFTAGQKQVSVDLKKTKEEANSAAKQIEASGKQAAQFFTKLRNEAIGMFAVFMGARGIKDFVQSITNSDAAVGRLAKNLGMSTEGLSAWEGAAERVGGTAAGIDGSMQSLTSEFQNFALTGQSSVIPYFRALGVSISDNHGKMRDLGDIYLDLADKFSHMDPQRASAFGRALGMDQGTKKLLEEQRKLGVVNEKDARNAQQLQKNMADLRQAFTSVGRTIVNELSPVVLELLKHWSEWLQANREWIATDVAKWVHDTAVEIKDFAVGVNDIVQAMGGWKTVSEEIFAIWAISKVLGLVRGIGMVAAAFGLLGGGGAGGAAKGLGLFSLFRAFAPLAFLSLTGPGGGGDRHPETDDERERMLKEHPGMRAAPRLLDEHHRPLPEQPGFFSRTATGAKHLWNRMNDWTSQNTTFGPSDKPVLDLVGKTEGTDKGRGYNETLGYGKYTDGDQNLTGMTLKQIDELQTKMLNNPDNKLHSSALGRYQITQTTLRDMISKHGIDTNSKFDAKMQDKLASTLIRERTAGAQTESEYLRALATIWASLPDPSTGKSYYGQGTGASVDEVLKAVRAQKSLANAEPKGDSVNDVMKKLRGAPAPSTDGLAMGDSGRDTNHAEAVLGNVGAIVRGMRHAKDQISMTRQANVLNQQRHSNTTHDNSSETHIGTITINTKATDAKGIATDIGAVMKKQSIVPQSSYGLT